jgi:hypothetical protein
MPLRPARAARRGVIGAPVARTAATVGTAAVVVHGVRRRGDRREDRREDRRDDPGDLHPPLDGPPPRRPPDRPDADHTRHRSRRRYSLMSGVSGGPFEGQRAAGCPGR